MERSCAARGRDCGNAGVSRPARAAARSGRAHANRRPAGGDHHHQRGRLTTGSRPGPPTGRTGNVVEVIGAEDKAMREVLDVRRFTALDMHETAGTMRRRRIIRAEFVSAAPPRCCWPPRSCAAANRCSVGPGRRGQLSATGRPLDHAVPPGRLEAELAGVVDVRRQLTRAGAVQVLLLVPLTSSSRWTADSPSAKQRHPHALSTTTPPDGGCPPQSPVALPVVLLTDGPSSAATPQGAI